MRRLFLSVCLMEILLSAAPGYTAPPNGDENVSSVPGFAKSINRPSPADYRRALARRSVIEQADSLARAGTTEGTALKSMAARGRSLAKTGTDKVLVILVEFDTAHSDTFTWTPGVTTWDPLGRANSSEWTGNSADVGNAAASAKLAQVYGITMPTQYTYSGPLHNTIRPAGQADSYIWTPDFNNQWYYDIIFGNGVKFQYTRQDGSSINEDFTGYSVRKYYEDLSGGQYHIDGAVVGWLKLPHSMYWYGADPCPGARSGIRTSNAGAIPGAGTASSLVRDALAAVKTAYPNFDWRSYDQNGDGVIDRLWIIHAGIGEEDQTTLLNTTSYGDGAMWSHSSSLAPAYPVITDGSGTLYAGPYIMMPENCGISVLAHEFAHNLGAEDLYAYNMGNPSVGFWSIMCNSWTGYPNGFLPPSMDPWHLDNWGWLDPVVVSDPERVYKVNLGQASAFPGGSGVSRGARITLPDGRLPLPVQPTGEFEWWGGAQDLTNGMMTLVSPIAIPASGATLTLNMAWEIEEAWDFLWVQASSDSGATWNTLTNASTTSAHDPNWIGSLYGFPDDLSAAGIGGLTGTSPSWPAYTPQTFSLNSFAGKNILLRLWYMTDWGSVYNGPFVDSVKVISGSTALLNDTASPGSTRWTLQPPWVATDGGQYFSHNFYLQWRNATASGGYDRSLSDTRWWLAPVNSGLLVWYNNNHYSDNEVGNHLTDYPGFGPKGRMLVVDSHHEPYRRGSLLSTYPNEASNVSSYSLMRDAPFGLSPTIAFSYDGVPCASRPAAPVFQDSLGYYPGAEYVSLGSGYVPAVSAWCTKQWDASAVVPGVTPYGLKAPGYNASDTLNWGLVPSGSGKVSGYPIYGLGYAGGTGNPGDSGAAYGWNAKVLSEAPSGGTVVVWNSAADPLATYPDSFSRTATGGLSVPAPGVLANDQGPLGFLDVASAVLDTPTTHGIVALSEDGSFTYTPNAGYTGSDSFTYHAQTAYGAVSAPVSVLIGRRGDVNLDAQVNTDDVRLALRIAGGLAPVTSPVQTLASGDLNGNHRIDLLDAVRIARIAAGKDQ